jgi:hypothetical protein
MLPDFDGFAPVWKQLTGFICVCRAAEPFGK